MTLLSQRSVVVEIGSPGKLARRISSESDGLRIAFFSQRKSAKAPDPAEVSVYNLSPGSLGALTDLAAVTRILAGYGTEVQQVASGTIVPGSLQTERRDGDIVSSWQIQDGGYDMRSIYVSQGYIGLVRASEIIEDVRKQTSWARGSITLGNDVSYRQGYWILDTVQEALDGLCRDCRSRWSVIDGRLSIWPYGQARVPQIPLLTPDTGLLESRRTESGAQFLTLLMPGIRQGDRVRVVRPRFSGDWLVREVQHRGDSGYDIEYTSQLEAVPA